LQDPDGLQNLQGLTHLQDLRLNGSAYNGDVSLKASMLSGLQRLTRLKLQNFHNYTEGTGLDPEVIAGKTQLEHLKVVKCRITGGSAGVAQLLSHLQPLQQLTYLHVGDGFFIRQASPPSAAYSALTGSSKLQHLDISSCLLPHDVWQHVFPAGRQLPNLWQLDVRGINRGNDSHSDMSTVPEASRLVSCCPGLQSLNMQSLQCTAELLAPLTGLSGLQELSLSPFSTTKGLGVVCQLTWLRRLYLGPSTKDTQTILRQRQLQQLTQLKQLTHLELVPQVHTGCKKRGLADSGTLVLSYEVTLPTASLGYYPSTTPSSS
jgi:hypothetical protein